MATKFTGIRIPLETREKLKAAAEADGRSMSQMAVRMIEYCLKQSQRPEES